MLSALVRIDSVTPWLIPDGAGEAAVQRFIADWVADLPGGEVTGRFVDVSSAAGITDTGWSTGAAFADLDGDGDLDLYVARYLEFDAAKPPPPASFKGIAVMAGPRGLAASQTACSRTWATAPFAT